MINLKSETRPPPRRQRARWFLLLLLIVPVAGLVEERWRGRLALQSWEHDMAAKGEVFDAAQLWPPVTAQGVEFSNQLAAVVKNLNGRLQNYAGINAVILDESGQNRRGSQESHPAIFSGVVSEEQTYTWQDLNRLLQQNQPALQSLRELLKNPPDGISYDISQRLEDNSPPDFVSWRVAAQVLYASAINNLHAGDLEAATRDIKALLSFGKAGDSDPDLGSYLIRMAIIGLSVDVCWDALQADGWTEPQLAALQEKCLAVTNLLSQWPRAFEAERIKRIYRMNWFRSHGYQEWIAQYKDRCKGFGWKLPPADTATTVQVWRQWVFHPVWSFAWADQEESKYLQDTQPELSFLRESSRRQSCLWLEAQTAASHQNYQVPFAAWRFYARLPLADSLSEPIIRPEIQKPAYPYPDFSNAWHSVMKNLTLHEMVITAIAIKRYELKHGNPPADLAALVPDFLPAPPPDLMDGRPLRYRLESDRSFLLYSVGDDGRDDGGARDLIPNNHPQRYPSSLWDGKDLVWPQIARKTALVQAILR